MKLQGDVTDRVIVTNVGDYKVIKRLDGSTMIILYPEGDEENGETESVQKL